MNTDETSQTIKNLTARVAALQQLLDIHERTVSEQSERLEQAKREAEKRVEEVKSSEERYTLSVRGSTDGLWDWDVPSDEVYFAPRFKELLGYRDDEIANRFEEWLSRLHPDDVEPTMAAVENHLYRRVPYDVEYRLLTKSGEYRWFRARGQALWDAGGNPTRMSGSITDMTLHKQAQAALREAKQSAEAANRGKSAFVANMSHEMRTPLNGIIGMTELALATELTSVQRDYLETVAQSADSLLLIINDVLDFSKIDAGKFELDSIAFRLQETIDLSMAALAERAHRKGLELVYQVSPDVPDELLGDPIRMRQILTNLVGNAIKFTDEGEVSVRVAPESISNDAVCIEISVSDTGVGIAPEWQPRIFESFTQTDPSRTRRYGGTGLGLAIASQLTRLMGGRLTVESEVGKGSVFRATLRFRKQPCAEKSANRSSAKSLAGMSALLVDDNETNCRVLEGLLRNWAMKPTVARSGERALAALDEARQRGVSFDIVLVDGRMPQMDGFTLVERIRERPELSGATIMMLASTDLQEEIARARELGIAAYLVKPINPSRLMSSLMGALGEPVASPSAAPGTIARDSLPPLHILLAEDGRVNRKLVMALLQGGGHRFVTAGSGTEALAAFESHRFDLVLMDVQMPQMDGLEASTRIREMERATGTHVPIVALTAHAMKGDRERCLAAGMDDYIAKPFRAGEFLRVVSDLMNERRPRGDVVDWEVAMKTTGGDAEMLGSIVEVFLGECPGLMSAIREAAAGRDAGTLQRAAHTLKGSLQHFGAERAGAWAATLEESARDGNWDDVSRIVDALDRDLADVIDALRERKRREDPS